MPTSPSPAVVQRKGTKAVCTRVLCFFLFPNPTNLLNSRLAMRQTWEEIGLDLAESDYTCVGQLDDREITTSLGKRLLMILSPFG